VHRGETYAAIEQAIEELAGDDRLLVGIDHGFSEGRSHKRAFVVIRGYRKSAGGRDDPL